MSPQLILRGFSDELSFTDTGALTVVEGLQLLPPRLGSTDPEDEAV